jgi:hypothetical protein
VSIIANLDAATLALFSGGDAADEINAALKTAALDTFERGKDEKSRKVVITIEMKQDEEKPQELIFSLQASPKLPGGKKITERVGTDGKGNLFFRDDGEEGEVEGDESEAA